jgi:hypothetical protein
MKILKYREGNYKLFGYKSVFTAYGTIINNNQQRYSLEYTIPFSDFAIKLYSKPVKPFFKNLIVLDALALLPYAMLCVLFAVFFIGAFILNYPYSILIKRSFFTETWELLSGWLWVALGIYGTIRIFI